MNREIGLDVYQVIWSGCWSRCETCTNMWWCLLIFVFSLNVTSQLSTKINEILISCLRGVAQTISFYDKSVFIYLKDLDNNKNHEDT